jgi:hypothetical protein
VVLQQPNPPVDWQVVPAPKATQPPHPVSIYEFAEAPTARLTRVMSKLSSFRELEENWDGEGALPVSEEAISRAKSLLQEAYRVAEVLEVRWQDPNLAPSLEGGVNLLWKVGNRRTYLRVLPRHTSVRCTTQVKGESANIQCESTGDAIMAAVRTMRSG